VGGRITTMGIDHLISEIDAEIARLNEARALLAGLTSTATPKKRGRPAKAAGAARVVKAVTAAAKPAKTKKRTLSPEARQAIADAQKKRWAKVARLKKTAAKAAAAESAEAPAKATAKAPAKAAKKAPAKAAVKPAKKAPAKKAPAKKAAVKKAAVKKAPAKKAAEPTVVTPVVAAESATPKE